MNRGFLESLPVQQMMGTGNPNWWSMNNMRPPPPLTTTQHQQQHNHNHSYGSDQQQMINISPFLSPSLPNLFPPHYLPSPTNSSSSSSSSSTLHNNITSWNDNQELPSDSWSLSQLLMGGLVGEEEKMFNNFLGKKLENWEEQVLNHHVSTTTTNSPLNSQSSCLELKQEKSNSPSYVYLPDHQAHDQDFLLNQVVPKPTTQAWSPHQQQQPMPNSSPNSCVTTSFSSTTSNMLDFSSNIKADVKHPPPDRSECNSPATGVALVVKKPRVQPSSSQSTFKVKKEKVGDRITALHQIVSPFGKTDTASVLLEAIGYIRFLQSQIEALSLPYLNSGSGNMRHQQHSVQGEMNCVFPEDPGQLINVNCMNGKGTLSDQDTHEEPIKDLKSRGLCLVPKSCIVQVGNDNGGDYWSATHGGPPGFR